MKKVLLTLLTACSLLYTTAQNNRLFDRPMQIKSMLMKVDADCFTATTFLEIEFFNPNDEEIEGLFRFSLMSNQVITNFQLDLNGRYRDGSIEEKWKARTAYNTIVGKRVDPALLSLEWANNYRLNIYPVPAKGSRKVTLTIQQTLQEEKGRLWYRFALNKTDTAKQLRVFIKTTGCAYPATDNGFIANENFQSVNSFYEVNKSGENVPMWRGINFSFPVSSSPSFCTQTKDGQNYFALRVHFETPPPIPIHPKKLLVYWDVSFSSAKQNIEKEISFLKQYLQRHGVEQLTIVVFNEQITPSKVFFPQQNKNWVDYLKSLQYDGATKIDFLNLSDDSHDAIILFSDGYVSYGSKMIKAAFKPLFTVSTIATDSTYLKALISNSGGTYVDLNKHTVSSAVEKASYVTNQLLSIQSSTRKTTFEKTGSKNDFLFYGVIPEDDTLSFVYGTSSNVYRNEKIVLRKNGCYATGIDRLPMLNRFASFNQWYDWEEVLEFGLRGKIVTANTSYIVLEKTEDYIKYNIAPPKELEEECARQGYITKSSKTRRQQLRERGVYDILNGVVTEYNDKLRVWDPSAVTSISISPNDMERMNYSTGLAGSITARGANFMLQGKAAGVDVSSANLNEVVVVGYGAVRRSLGYSVTTISPNTIGTPILVEQALSGRVPGLLVTPSQGFTGAAASVQIRGISSFTGNQPLYVLDGFPVEGNINDIVSVNDIESISVLKDAAAGAIYGTRASNGAIVITTKKYRPYYRNYSYGPYKLKNMEDEDYLQEIKRIPVAEKLEHYYSMRQEYVNDASFYVDMAQHFFKSGLKTQAHRILLNAAEVSGGNSSALLAMAYTYEDWKEFEKAVEIYRNVTAITPTDLTIRRSLGWALYQNGNIQEAVETFYNAIEMNLEGSEDHHQSYKASMLNDMNAIIAIHKDSLDLSSIPVALISPMPVDLRIYLDGNVGYFYNINIKEPGGKECSWDKPISKNGGYFGKKWNYYGYGNEYNMKKAVKGQYSINVNYYDYYGSNAPRIIRIMCFKNFGRKDQCISIQNVIMNNQSGVVEIGEVEWGSK